MYAVQEMHPGLPYVGRSIGCMVGEDLGARVHNMLGLYQFLRIRGAESQAGIAGNQHGKTLCDTGPPNECPTAQFRRQEFESLDLTSLDRDREPNCRIR